MIFTGERVLPDDPRLRRTYLQSLTAYKFAQKYCKNKKVLDLCCGEGYGSAFLSQKAKEVTALDYNLEAIKSARIKYRHFKNLKFINADFMKALPRLKKFDVVVSYQAIEHFEDLNRYLKQVRYLLKKDGIFLVSTPNKSKTFYGFNPYHYYDFTSDDFNALLKRNFSKVALYGVFGDKLASHAKAKNETLTKLVLSYFPKSILKIIPVSLLRFMYTIGSGLIKQITYLKEKEIITNLTEDSFHISKNDVKKSLDLLAVAKK